VIIYSYEEDIIGWHEILYDIYKGEEYPINISPGYRNKGQINFIASFVQRDKLYGQRFQPSALEKGAYYLYEICKSHAFNDGNKRTALVTTYYFLLWNSYWFTIPTDAEKFLFKIADANENVTYQDTLNWLREFCIPGWRLRIRHTLLLLLLPIFNRVDLFFIDYFVGILLFRPLPEFLIQFIRSRSRDRTNEN